MNLRLQIKVALTLILISFVFCSQKANAQVGIGTTTPDNSAMLEIKSGNKGILIPRLTTVQRTAISAPAKGLMVFDKIQRASTIMMEVHGNHLKLKPATLQEPESALPAAM